MYRFLQPVTCLAALCLAAAACNTPKNVATAPPDHEVEELTRLMTGDFNSTAQSLRDSAYFDIRLHIRPIWPKDKNNRWLYVEQAAATAQDKPYRQRVYKVERDTSGKLRSVVYMLPEPQSKWIGGHNNPAIFDQIKPSKLSLREGCAVYLSKRSDGSYGGGTHDSGCESTLRGASYATSMVVVKSTMLRSWDQGFNDKKEQVWGATKGGYEFVKEQK